MFKKARYILMLSILLLSFAAIASDPPFQKGKTYIVAYQNHGGLLVNVLDIKDFWLYVDSQDACKFISPKASKCWLNANFIGVAYEIRPPKKG